MSLLDDRPPAGPVGITTPSQRDSPTPTADRARTRPRPLRELIIVMALWVAYSLGRLVADGHVSAAITNAHRVWDIERTLHLPRETAVQHLLLHSETLVRAANGYYAFVHFPATAAFLLWLYLRRPAHYLWARRVLATLTALALVGHLLFPLAPPRILAGAGLVDTAHLYGPSVYGSPDTDTLANQYAAMPSLHVGWAVLVAIAAISATHSHWHWLWLAYPAITLIVVVGTANHYWLDAIVACALLAAVLLALPAPRSRPRPRQTADLA